MKKLLLLFILTLSLLLLASCGESETFTVDFTVNGTVVYSMVLCEGDTPTPPPVADYATDDKNYAFVGWDKEIVPVSEDITYAAVFSDTAREYDVTFLYGGSTAGTPVKVAYGETPTAPTDLNYSTVDRVYTFTGWNVEIVPVTRDVVYTAQYTSVPRKYTVTLVYGGESHALELPYGATPTIPSELDYATAEKAFRFDGWDKTVTSVSGDVTYTASYTESARLYDVTFVWGDPSDPESKTLSLAFGATPSAPTEDLGWQSSTVKYTFKAWDKEISAVSGNATYTATYDETPLSFTVTFVYDGKSENQTLGYGATPTLPTPKASYTVDGKVYAFTGGWDKTPAPVTEDVTYTAVYRLSEYLIYSNDFNSIEDFDHMASGEKISQPIGNWTLTANSPYVDVSFKTETDPNAPANKYIALGLHKTEAHIQMNLKTTGGLSTIENLTKLSISFDLAKKPGVTLAESNIRFRATGTSDTITFFHTVPNGSAIKFFGVQVGEVKETFQNVTMTFDFETGAASISIDGTPIDSANATMPIPSKSSAASLLDWVATTKKDGFVFNWTMPKRTSSEVGLLIDNLVVRAY